MEMVLKKELCVLIIKRDNLFYLFLFCILYAILETNLVGDILLKNTNVFIYRVGIIINSFFNILSTAYLAAYSLLIDFISNFTFATLLKLVLTGPGQNTDTFTLDFIFFNSSYIDVLSLST